MFALFTIAGLFLLINWSQIELLGVAVILVIIILRLIVLKHRASKIEG